jgi:hypothetical protein
MQSIRDNTKKVGSLYGAVVPYGSIKAKQIRLDIGIN